MTLMSQLVNRLHSYHGIDPGETYRPLRCPEIAYQEPNPFGRGADPFFCKCVHRR